MTFRRTPVTESLGLGIQTKLFQRSQILRHSAKRFNFSRRRFSVRNKNLSTLSFQSWWHITKSAGKWFMRRKTAQFASNTFLGTFSGSACDSQTKFRSKLNNNIFQRRAGIANPFASQKVQASNNCATLNTPSSSLSLAVNGLAITLPNEAKGDARLPNVFISIRKSWQRKCKNFTQNAIGTSE